MTVNDFEVVHVYESRAEHADGVLSALRQLLPLQHNSGLNVSINDQIIGSTHDFDNKTLYQISWVCIFKLLISCFKKNPEASQQIFHLHGMWSLKAKLFIFFKKRKQDHIVISPHGMLSEDSFSRKKVKKIIYHRLVQSKFIKWSGNFIVNSVNELDDVLSNSVNFNASVIEHGVLRSDIYQNENIKKGDSFVYLGRLHPQKNLKLLLRCWNFIEKNYSNFDLKIFGPMEGLYARQCVALSAALGNKRVKFEGEISFQDRFSVFDNACALVLPSDRENFGLVVLEAWASGVPVLQSEDLPLAYWSDNGCGYTFARNEEELYHAMEKVIQLSDNEFQKISKEAIKVVSENFSSDIVCAKYIKFYEKVRSGS